MEDFVEDVKVTIVRNIFYCKDWMSLVFDGLVDPHSSRP